MGSNGGDVFESGVFVPDEGVVDGSRHLCDDDDPCVAIQELPLRQLVQGAGNGSGLVVRNGDDAVVCLTALNGLDDVGVVTAVEGRET